MNEIKLSKASGEEQIKAYFTKVLELKQSGIEFPVDLDTVWHLAYSDREKAYNLLKRDFIENDDYQTFSSNGGKVNNRPRVIYKLSVECLEYFIAKKVKPVFEVYRKVFHKSVELHQQLIWCGIPTVYFNGRVWVHYRSVLRMFNYSTKSGAVANRKKYHPVEFEKVYNQNFVSVTFAEELKKQAEVRQLQFEFDKKMDILSDVVKIEDKELRVSIANKLMAK